MKVGLIGLPGSGATTLFSLFTGRDYQKLMMVKPGEISLGSTQVPDSRIDELSKIFNPRKTTYAHLEFADIPVQLNDHGAYDSRTVNDLRPMQVIALVIRAFENPAVPHPAETVNPLRDLTTTLDEAVLTDLLQVEKRLERLQKEHLGNSQEARILLQLKTHLEDGHPLRSLELNPSDEKLITGFRFISRKPWLILINTGSPRTIDTKDVREYCDDNDLPWLRMSAEMELEIAGLDPEDRREFLQELGETTGARSRFIRGAYQYLDLISFFTVGEDEVRAWSIRRGSSAVEAAGKIHSDLARGFIRAEVVSYDDFLECGSMQAAKNAGKFRLEGKEYPVSDGDIISIRFSV